MWAHLIVSLLATFLMAGCLNSQESEARTYWGEGGPGAPGLQTGHNFYLTDLDRYPGYGIFLHHVSIEEYTLEVEKISLVSGIKQCRSAFGEAFSMDNITAFDALQSHREKWITQQQHFVRFRPDWVVIVLGNRKRTIPDDDPLMPSYAVGYVFPALDFFNSSISPEQLPVGGD